MLSTAVEMQRESRTKVYIMLFSRKYLFPSKKGSPEEKKKVAYCFPLHRRIIITHRPSLSESPRVIDIHLASNRIHNTYPRFSLKPHRTAHTAVVSSRRPERVREKQVPKRPRSKEERVTKGHEFSTWGKGTYRGRRRQRPRQQRQHLQQV